MKAKDRVEKTAKKRVRSERTSEKSRGGGRLDGKAASANPKKGTKVSSAGADRKPF